MNLSTNKNELVSIQNVSLFTQSDISNNDYNFKIEENKIDKLEDDTNIIKIEQEKIKNEMKRVLDEASKLKQENEIFKTENASLSNENKALQDENEKYKEQIINYENEIKIYKDENESYRRQLNDSIYKTKNNELLKIKETYENEIQLLRENFEKLNKENESLKEEIEELKNNYTAVTNENESLVNDINNLKANITNHQKDILNEDEIKRLIEENSVFRIKAQENESLKKQIEEYKVKLKEQNEEREEEEDSQEFIEKNEVIGDIIHNKNELDMITNKINKENKKIIINLLYKATADSDKASVFHEKCDKAKNSIVLVETENGMRFGGYTTCSWSGNCVDKIDPEAFIFSFDKMKTYDNIPGDEAIGCYPKFGPIFLGCQIKIFDNFFIKGGTTFERELNFNTEEDYELTGGDREFKVKDIEVYEVLFE
jgi:chromosome segregation ATPase